MAQDLQNELVGVQLKLFWGTADTLIYPLIWDSSNTGKIFELYLPHEEERKRKKRSFGGRWKFLNPTWWTA